MSSSVATWGPSGRLAEGEPSKPIAQHVAEIRDGTQQIVIPADPATGQVERTIEEMFGEQPISVQRGGLIVAPTLYAAAGSVSASSTALTVAGGTFSSADVGKLVTIASAGRNFTMQTTVTTHATTIAAASGTSITLATAAFTEAAAADVWVGNDYAEQIQEVLDLAATVGAATTSRQRVIIPHGLVVPIGNLLDISDWTYLENYGTILFLGNDSIGTIVRIRSDLDCGVIGHGFIDGNNTGNTNGIGLSGQSNLGGSTERVILSGQTIRRCRHGGAHLAASLTDVTKIGNGGGKGISPQNGPRRLIVRDTFVEDCATGFSSEGAVANDGLTHAVMLSNLQVHGCEFTGVGFWSQLNEPDTGDHHEVLLSNVLVSNSGKDVVAADGFAPIVMNCGVGVRGSIKVRDNRASTRLDILRGSMRFCELDIKADVKAVRHVINHEVFGGYSQVDTPSRHNTVNAKLMLRSEDATGYLLRGASGVTLAYGEYNVSFETASAGVFEHTNVWPGAGRYENTDRTLKFKIRNNSTGRDVESNTYFSDSLADDATHIMRLPFDYGHVFLAINAGTIRIGTFSIDGIGTATITALTGNGASNVVHADFNATTGTITVGSGSVDAKFNISINNAGSLYLLNRLGASVQTTCVVTAMV